MVVNVCPSCHTSDMKDAVECKLVKAALVKLTDSVGLLTQVHKVDALVSYKADED